jgi:hypothetical protein
VPRSVLRAEIATPASGFSGQNLIPFTATFTSFQVFNHLTRDQLQQLAPTFPDDTWLSFQKTEGPSTILQTGCSIYFITLNSG